MPGIAAPLRYLPSLTLGACLLAAPASHAEAPLMVKLPRLTLDTAQHIAKTALLSCRAKGVSVAVTLLDRGGNVQVVLRDTLASDLTLAISRDKAYTALSFNQPTAALSARAETPLGRMPRMAMFAGGLPIHAGGTLVGAIGVSGAPSGETDQACAKAGIDSLQTDLDMAGG
ncbi:adenosylcobalamin biosynthesis, GlcG-related protein [Acidihalobacter yilgarnensis]|uniref:Adenosylcobalamin biosynthesis, GlcG-related protein n=1 Tax=Acidihalobacter yilgarnensis TaxID=2819280 RepID=A0A1D8IQJ7_9GAMM|nr:heme-binding protein [Acidihalobacter yilgarnensis]AOU98727.1 adenosylcobalamin biosynthesis, GlcG-related protein [Acidihalobacter yilgarnensis]